MCAQAKQMPFGLTKIEYVGRVLFFDESTMRDETIRKVLDFPLPTRVKQHSSFIGLVQYFRNHIYADSQYFRNHIYADYSSIEYLRKRGYDLLYEPGFSTNKH